MGLTFIQAGSANSNPAGATTLTMTTTLGSLLVALVTQGHDNTNTATMSDSAGQTWTQTASGYTSADSTHRAAVYFITNSAALTTITVTWTSITNSRIGLVVFEISGEALSSVEDSSVNNTDASGTTANTGSLTTSNAADILIMGVHISASFSGATAGSGYTIPTNGTEPRGAMQYKIVAATQSGVTTSMTWTTSGVSGNVFAAFKAVAASSAPQIAGRILNQAVNRASTY